MFTLKKPIRPPLVSDYNRELVRLIEKQREVYTAAKRSHDAAHAILTTAKPLLEQMRLELAEMERIRDEFQRILKEATNA